MAAVTVVDDDADGGGEGDGGGLRKGRGILGVGTAGRKATRSNMSVIDDPITAPKTAARKQKSDACLVGMVFITLPSEYRNAWALRPIRSAHR